MGALTFEVRTGVDAFTAGEWASLAPDGLGLYGSQAWIRAVEDLLGPTTYLVAADAAGAVRAALPVASLEGDPNALYRPWDVFGSEALEACRGHVGLRRGYVNSGILSRRTPDADLLEAMSRRAREVLRDWGEPDAGLCAQYVTVEHLPGARDLVRAGGRDAAVLPVAFGTRLVLPGSSVDDYLASRRRRRPTVLREMDVFASAGYEVAALPMDEVRDELGPLLANVQARYGQRVSAEGVERLLSGLSRHLGERARVYAAFDGVGLVAYSLCFEHGSELVVRLAGFDYARLRGAFEYFNVVFYLPLRDAYARGLSSLELGTEGYPAKVMRGARLEPRLSVVETRPGWDVAALEGAAAARVERLLEGVPRHLWPD